MSGSETNKINNENLILSANATIPTSSFPPKSHNNSTTIKSTGKRSQNQRPEHQQFDTEQHTNLGNNTLPTECEQQPSQQRRAFPPPTGYQKSDKHLDQESSINTLTTNNFQSHLNQLQTVATIHQQSSQYQGSSQDTNINLRSAPTAASTNQQQAQAQLLAHTTNIRDSKRTATTPVTPSVKIPINTRRNLNHLKPPTNHNKTIANQDNHFKGSLHAVPPSYQPPPQVQQTGNSNTGILKNINSYQNNQLSINDSSINTISTNNNKYLSDSQKHLQIKYPPDIPQLSTVYIPASLKSSTSKNRLLQHQQQQQRQLQHQFNQQLNTNHTKQDMLKFVRKPEQEHPSPNTSVTSSGTGIPTTGSARLTIEQNRQLQSLINELRALKDQNQRLLDDNQELRDLCCFLDDDRQKGRKLAREWQRFGRYTASVMRQEVAAYQNKLRQLDDKQQELITDNLELKELCLYLDEERAHIAANALCTNCGGAIRNNLRDDGDGSSSTTNFEQNYDRQINDYQLRSSLNDQTLLYVRSLERRIQQLEEERVTTATPTTNHLTQQQQHETQQQKQLQQTQQQEETFSEPLSSRPEAVVRALQVLEVREQLERDRHGNLSCNIVEQMDDGEKALVREMCNVVWRKLEGNPNGPSHSIEPI